MMKKIAFFLVLLSAVSMSFARQAVEPSDRLPGEYHITHAGTT